MAMVDAGKSVRLRTGRAAFFTAALAVFLLDRLTKSMIVANVQLYDRITIIPHLLWITHVQNSGAAFSFSLFRPYVFLALAVIASIGIVAYQLTHRLNLAANAVLGIILGGALGNGFDRLISGGSVTDLIEVPHWPVFNVADSAISIGVVLILLGHLRRPSSS